MFEALCVCRVVYMYAHTHTHACGTRVHNAYSVWNVFSNFLFNIKHGASQTDSCIRGRDSNSLARALAMHDAANSTRYVTSRFVCTRQVCRDVSSGIWTTHRQRGGGTETGRERLRLREATHRQTQTQELVTDLLLATMSLRHICQMSSRSAHKSPAYRQLTFFLQCLESTCNHSTAKSLYVECHATVCM